MKDIKYLIIDEMSMVGRHFLAIVDMRLRKAFPKHSNHNFSGRSIILVSDFGQLPPVCDIPMYSQDHRPSDSLFEDGRNIYQQFQEVYKLEAVQRQLGNSDKQCQFRNLLILTTREEVDRINADKLRSLNQPVAKIGAVHTGGFEASKADSNTAKNLDSGILLARNARIMLTANLWVATGIVNVSFDQYCGPTLTNLDGSAVVPIVLIRRMLESKSGVFSHLQFPLSLA
ncbi:ATP-dependent DNA helicase PIF1-like [Rhizophagus irregularis DAOM 181602=DAOM 197198]|uniref:ATP-dependent DNA helicase n=1 Tax=Rhizophagus irregularis (strain DAOM 197198w) TaxID=1432141 RepID=A0A015ID92_RHIIW|nr:Pif1p [Rhizophagus irregularis DAOM 197198w]GBC40218.2 ATP-dependent DNA helicase PIF1-like [Rhizophagus irregularis DAOM 181602=DAOM 197198]